ncbi:FAR1-RELATED SEQUENCE 4-like protein [Drosera capensis]
MDSGINLVNLDIGPHDGMEFDTNEAAYAFYKEYAKSVGFGTAKLSSRRSRASKEFIDAKFSCIRYGIKQQSDDAVNPRPSPKIGCKASLHVKRKPNGKWYIHKFVKEHNHELLPEQVHLFRSHRDGDNHKNDSQTLWGKVLDVSSKQLSSSQNIDCLENYMKTQEEKGRRLSLEPGDAQHLLDLFMDMQEIDPRFFYAVDLNEEHCLRNTFWVDYKGIDDYTKFGDVVSFETTYFTNKYRVPLVLFIGVNHHIQPTLLGCALIGDGTVYTFVWLLKTWLMAMDGKPPTVILTDQNNVLEAAISAVLPQSRHCLSLWNVLELIPQRLEYISLWIDSFLEKFSECIFNSWTGEQFTQRWLMLLETFKLNDDEWMRSLYENRFMWVPVFMRGTSFAGLCALSRDKSLNSSFDKYIGAETSVGVFIEQYKLLLEGRLQEEAKSEFESWHEEPELKSPSPFEKQMAFVYTHEIFKKFQVEVLGAAACHLKKEKDENGCITYGVKDFEVDQEYMVEWAESKSEICCSCCLFEYRGYLCRHAIVVLQMSGVFTIPMKYVQQRWTNVALSKHGITEKLDDVQAKVRRYNDLCRRAIILGEEGSLSQEIILFILIMAIPLRRRISPAPPSNKRSKVRGNENNAVSKSNVTLGLEVATPRTQNTVSHPQTPTTRLAQFHTFTPLQFPTMAPDSTDRIQLLNLMLHETNKTSSDVCHLPRSRKCAEASGYDCSERLLQIRSRSCIAGMEEMAATLIFKISAA